VQWHVVVGRVTHFFGVEVLSLLVVEGEDLMHLLGGGVHVLDDGNLVVTRTGEDVAHGRAARGVEDVLEHLVVVPAVEVGKSWVALLDGSRQLDLEGEVLLPLGLGAEHLAGRLLQLLTERPVVLMEKPLEAPPRVLLVQLLDAN